MKEEIFGFIMWLTVVFLTVVLFLQGCIPGVTSQNVQHLSSEQIKALAETKQQWVGCSTIAGGPPIVGRSVFLTFPPNVQVSVKFGSDCQIFNQ